MDPDKVMIGVIITIALGIGGFILWGPCEKYKRKPGRIGGLVNLGFTCFLNTLLQALAACPPMLEWLSQQETVSDSLVRAVKEALLVLNGQHATISDNPFTPSEVIKSLVHKGWVISPGEQDAHELFQVIMTTLLEETNLENQVLSISDALESTDGNRLKCTRWYPRKIESNTAELQSPTKKADMNKNISACGVISCPAFMPFSELSLPFQGLLTSQLQCTVCNYKSSILYDKFDSLSLHLPTIGENIFIKKLTLYQLLNKFVSTEVVRDVSCEKCNQQQGKGSIKANAMKTLNFGKLPRCLCFHIQRTTWQRSGQPYKRYDYIEFPEYLSMDNYTFIQTQKKTLQETFHSTPVGDIKAPSDLKLENFSVKHLYRLAAVVVHTGSLDSGHFVTYRRAPIRDQKWYYTSDSEVRESSLNEALQACAYMLFYNKCSISSRIVGDTYVS